CRRRHAILVSDWSSDVCSSDLTRVALAVTLMLALATAGCSYRIGSLFGSERDDGKSEHTDAMAATTPAAGDLALARAAATEAVRSGERRVGKEVSRRSRAGACN